MDNGTARVLTFAYKCLPLVGIYHKDLTSQGVLNIGVFSVLVCFERFQDYPPGWGSNQEGLNYPESPCYNSQILVGSM